VLRRIPFTLAVVAAMLVLGVATGSLWSALEDRPLWDVVAYGLPAFQDGRWWTPVTGSFFAVAPWQYLPVAGGFLVLVGFAEWVFGTRRTAIAACVTQLAAVVGAAAFLSVASGTGWEWAVRVADDLDVGFSAGAMGAVAAASVAVSPPWRARLRAVLVMYAVVAFLYVGLLWDLEHLIGVAVGLLLGPVLVGRAPRLTRPRLSRREWRLTAAALFLLNAVVRLVLYFVPADGPLGATSDDSDVWHVLVGAAISLVLANGLRTGSRRAWRWSVGITVTVAALLGLVAVVAILDPGEVVLELDDAGTAVPALVVDIGLWILQLVVLLLGRHAFTRPSRRTLRRGDALVGVDDRGQAIELLKANGGSTLSWMGTWPGINWFVPPDASGRPAGYVAFQLHNGVAVALGDPVAPDAAVRAEVLDAFVDEQDRLGQQFCLFSVTDEVVAWAEARGYRTVHVAEEAIIDLPDLEFRGKSWQDVRTALNRAGKEGIAYRSGRLAEMPRGVQVQVRAISELWVSDKGLPEMGFTLGGVDEALDPEVMVGLAVDAEGTVHGVTSWMPVFAPGGGHEGWTLDVMRRLPDGFRPVTEFLIASACLDFQAQGAQYVSLSGAPLAHAAGDDEALGGLERLLDTLGSAMEPLYGFRSLDSFKAKFSPRHRSLSMVFRDEAALPRIGIALTRAYLPDATVRDLARAGLDAARG
jgi:lysylphosphatidylglycerol synthetase-like protein (DUF2156 family)